MVFVLEDLTDDDREKMGFVKTIGDANKWDFYGLPWIFFLIIDRERDIIGYHITDGIELLWNGDVIRLDIDREIIKLDNDLYTKNKNCTYELRSIHIPQKLENETETIKEMAVQIIEELWNHDPRYQGVITGGIAKDVKIIISPIVLSKAMIKDVREEDFKKKKGFNLEGLTDDEREKMGFARTMDDTKLPNKRNCGFVGVWVRDHEKDVALITINMGIYYELHWKHDVIKIRVKHIPLEALYNMREIIIPRHLSSKENEIKKLIIAAFKEYGTGLTKRNHHNGKVDFLPDTEIRFQDEVKSRFKIADFAIIQ